MNSKLIFLITVPLVALSLDAQAASDGITRQIPVTADFIEGSVGSGGTAGGIEYRINLTVANNFIELCGAVAYSNVRLKIQYRNFLRDSAFVINGKKVVKDLRYWNTVNRRAWKSAKANCRSTGIKANTKIKDIDIAWSKRTYRY